MTAAAAAAAAVIEMISSVTISPSQLRHRRRRAESVMMTPFDLYSNVNLLLLPFQRLSN